MGELSTVDVASSSLVATSAIPTELLDTRPQRTALQLTIALPSGNVLLDNVSVCSTTKIKELKQLAEVAQDYMEIGQLISSAGTILKDEITVGECDVRDGDTLITIVGPDLSLCSDLCVNPHKGLHHCTCGNFFKNRER